MNNIPAAIVLFLLFFSVPAVADIYRWVDETGTIHFTDDISNIPAAHRGKTKAVLKESPPVDTRSSSTPEGKGITQPTPPSSRAPSPGDAAGSAARERNELASEAEQLKAKIAAKEALIKKVEDRQNLALNPLRARVVDNSELELYKKYQAELPDDRERLRELEFRLQQFK